MNINEIRKMKESDIISEIKKLKEKLLSERMSIKMQVIQKMSSEGINVSKIKDMKKDLARFYTILKEKKVLFAINQKKEEIKNEETRK